VVDRVAIGEITDSEALILALDSAGRILLFNTACERASGCAQSEVVGLMIWDALIPPEHRDSAREAFARRRSSTERAVHEDVWITKSGERRVIAWRSGTLADPPTGEVVVVATGVDVTELRASETTLRDRAALLESLLRASRDGVVTILESGEVTSFSAGAEKLFGYTSDEVIGRNVNMLMPEPYASAHDGYLSAYVHTGEAKIIGVGREVTARRKDGAEFPIHLMVEEGRLGETRFFTGVIRDISERRAVERSLKEKEIQFETVFNAVPDALVITDTAHKIVACNPAFERIFRADPETCIGKPEQALYEHGEDYERLYALRRSGGAAPRPIVVSFARIDGEVFPGETVSAELREAGGSILGYLALIRDVSEERRREEALRQAHKMEAIGQLTGGMAHDFNNLLTVIKGNLELLEVTASEGQRELIGEARGAADMSASLTSRMLAFARRQPLNPQDVDVNALVVSLSDLLRRTLGERIQLSTSLEPRLPPVLVDAAQLQNAVLNLALNARDAMPEGGGVAIETAALGAPDSQLLSVDPSAAGGWVTLKVSDTGRGIPPEIRARLFDPYVTTKAPGQGGGLGLAMVFGFVTQSGGRITVESEPGDGAAFTIYLPQAAASEDFPSARETELAAAPGGGEIVLLVEDNTAVRRLTSRQLAGLGYRVIEAADAEEALALVDRGETFDLLFTDIVMPGALDGLALAEAVRTRRPAARLLFTSGYVDPERVEQSGWARNVELLRKPAALADLAAAVRRALAG
jgi:PAS domain S-box-containing protein